MSDVTVSGEAPAINIDLSATKPAVVPAPAPANDKPEWLDARLAQARSAALKDAGFESVEDAKKAAKELNDKREAEKTDAQKRGELETSLKSKDKQLNDMSEALKAYATSQLAALTDAQRGAVALVAGDDPAKQLKTIEAFKSTWANAAAPAATVEAPKVVDTAPGRFMPKEGGGTSPADPKAVYEAIKQTNPILAARYATENGVFDS